MPLCIFVGLTLFSSFTDKATQNPDLFTPFLLEFIFILAYGIEGHGLASVFRDISENKISTIIFYHIRIAITICLLINDLIAIDNTPHFTIIKKFEKCAIFISHADMGIIVYLIFLANWLYHI